MLKPLEELSLHRHWWDKSNESVPLGWLCGETTFVARAERQHLPVFGSWRGKEPNPGTMLSLQVRVPSFHSSLLCPGMCQCDNHLVKGVQEVQKLIGIDWPGLRSLDVVLISL